MAITKVNHPDLLDLASETGATVFPKGTTAERPVSPEAGYIRFNTTDNVMETWDGTEWKVLDTFTPLPYSVDYLVVASGGGGGNFDAGGGGAGGFLSNSYDFIPNQEYIITIGGGGVGGQKGVITSGIGDNSSLEGGILSVTSIGGGGGASDNNTGPSSSGGSGGGSASGSNPTRGFGTLGQGNDGGLSSSSSNIGSGGGGAGAVGINQGGGGVGLTTSIITTAIAADNSIGEVSGGNVYFSGGGGSDSRTSGFAGGLGGGGAGSGSLPSNNGSPNTGGGGGAIGFNTSSQGGSGGSGVVILRMPTAKYSGTTTGSPTVTTDGTDTILIYKSSGTYTA